MINMLREFTTDRGTYKIGFAYHPMWNSMRRSAASLSLGSLLSQGS